MLFLAKINMENISKHITYAEAIHSQTAKRKGIDNTPNPTQIEAMKLLADFLDHQNLTQQSVELLLVNIVKDKQLILTMFTVKDLTLKCLLI